MIINKTNDQLKPNLKFPFPITSVTTRKVKGNRKRNLPLSNISVTGPICVKANPEPTSYGTCRQRASSVMGCSPVTSSGQKKHAFGLWLAARVTPSTTAEQSACCQHLPSQRHTTPNGAGCLPSALRWSLVTSLLLRAQGLTVKLCSACPELLPPASPLPPSALPCGAPRALQQAHPSLQSRSLPELSPLTLSTFRYWLM